MKIPLKVEESVGGIKPFIYFTIKAPHTFGYMRAFFDTGSPDTLISQTDASKLKIPHSASKSKSIYGISGNSIDCFEARISAIIFKDEKGNSVKPIVGKAYVTKSLKKSKRTQQVVSGTPNIFGVDFLAINKYKLIFDPANREAYLEV